MITQNDDCISDTSNEEIIPLLPDVVSDKQLTRCVTLYYDDPTDYIQLSDKSLEYDSPPNSSKNSAAV